MKLILTNYGLRLSDELLKSKCRSEAIPEKNLKILKRLRIEHCIPYRNQPQEESLVTQGMAQVVHESLNQEAIELQYQRNPLEHIQTVAFEFTTLCNLNCRHCYNATVPRTTEHDVEALKSAVDIFLALGVTRFDFIGGEVSKYGNRWLEVVQHIHHHSNAAIALLTSGWWCGQTEFRAAGKVYRDMREYLSELQRSGLTHLIFSLDGIRSKHDRSRGLPGLFEHILSAFREVKNAGIEPRVALLVRSGDGIAEYTELLSLISNRMKKLLSENETELREDTSVSNPIAISSNLIDIGNQARVKQRGIFFLPEVPDEMLHCKGFYRPSPWITIKANGEVATCRLVNAGEGYGNIHTQGLIYTLNHLQDSFVFRLHAERKLGEYRKYLDFDLFGKYFDHLCTPRAILTLLARRIQETGIDPDDAESLRRINLEIAQTTGHQPKVCS